MYKKNLNPKGFQNFSYPNDDYSALKNPIGFQSKYFDFFNLECNEIDLKTSNEKRKFYERLTRLTLQNDNESLAGICMNHWLTGNGEKLLLSDERIRNNNIVKSKLIEFKNIFLSRRDLRRGCKQTGQIAGIVPRILGNVNYKDDPWDGIGFKKLKNSEGSILLVRATFMAELLKKYLHGEIQRFEDLALDEKIKMDLYGSVHNTLLETEVTVFGTKLSNNTFKIDFKTWKARIKDNYNWESKFLMAVPNPDYKNRYNERNPICVNKEIVLLRHKNAVEIEQSNLAHPFPFETNFWTETNPLLLKSQIIRIP